MEGYDDLGPPTHPGELALDADIGGGRELDDGAALEIGDGGFGGAPGFDEAPEFNADLGDVEQVTDEFICIYIVSLVRALIQIEGRGGEA